MAYETGPASPLINGPLINGAPTSFGLRRAERLRVVESLKGDPLSVIGSAKMPMFHRPRRSMYGVYTYIYPLNYPNVGK